MSSFLLKKTSLSILVLQMTCGLAIAETEKSSKTDLTVTILGEADKRKEIAGSVQVVDKKTLDRFQHKDIHQALKGVSGVTVREEDGHGLRPNISIRGGRANRSSDITVLEDGILATPAPYAAPEAYYFPQMERMDSLEVIKGSGAIKHAPRTTNGVLNMTTKKIPTDKQADFVGAMGNDGTYRTGITTGLSKEHGGILLNAFHKQSDGFTKLDYAPNAGTGYDVQDVMGKIRLNTGMEAETYQEITLKAGYYDENSNETYLGLSDTDFGQNPYRRYAASGLDNMDVRAYQLAATHFAELTPDTNITTSIYRNTMDRAWYRLVSVGGKDISSIFNGSTRDNTALGLLDDYNTTGNRLTLRNNARETEAKGIQTEMDTKYRLGATENLLEVGARFHQDSEDRFQRQDRADIVNGRATVTQRGIEGAAGNQIASARVLSGFVQHETKWQDWTVTPGVRFEHIELAQKNYGANDPNRTGSTAFRQYSQDLNVWIPGIGFSYALEPNWHLLAGVHKGFAAPGVPTSTQAEQLTQEEESINYEIGTRYAQENLETELFGFYKDYDNLLGRDTLYVGNDFGQSFNGGEVVIKGVEASVQYNVASALGVKDYAFPLKANYTHMQGEFQSNFNSSFGEWGNVRSGFELPYLPQNQLGLSAGVEGEKWGVTLMNTYVDSMRNVAGTGKIASDQKIPSRWVTDVAAEYRFMPQVAGFVTVNNLLDENYLASRRPAGIRAGLPLTVMTGVKLSAF